MSYSKLEVWVLGIIANIRRYRFGVKPISILSRTGTSVHGVFLIAETNTKTNTDFRLYLQLVLLLSVGLLSLSLLLLL